MSIWRALSPLSWLAHRYPEPLGLLGVPLEIRRWSTQYRALGLACIVVVVVGLFAGCALPVKKAELPALTGALIVMRLQNRLEFPSAVSVEIASEADGSISAVTGRRQQSVPGRYADYLLALALPPERYSITAIRAAGQTAEAPSELLASMMIPFEVKLSDPAYLGRLVMASEPMTNVFNIEVQDHFDEDVLLFRSALAPLRTATIARSLIATSSLASVKVSGRQEAKVQSIQLGVDAVSNDSLDLLAPKARPAFTRFLTMKLPRAFAVSNAGDAASRSGEGAQERALRDCAKLGNEKSCRIFAVDNTMITKATCASAIEGLPSQARLLPRCPVQPPKMP